MAEGEVAATGSRNLGEVLKTKIGPAPLGVWAAVGLGIFLYLQRKKAAAGTGSGQQIDPAGNTGTIDPATGYVYGTTEDRTALAQSNNSGSDTSGSGSSGSGSTTAGQYPNNQAWANAAVNYLVGLGTDPTVATQAIQSYLESQTLTQTQQGEVNLAIQALGPPPTLPEPTQGNPQPINNPGGTPSATNPVTGLTATSSTSSTVSLGWNVSQNATSYLVSYGTTPAADDATTTAPGAGSGVTSGQVAHPGITIGNLRPGTTYYFKVQAQPAGTSGGWAGPVSKATAK